MIGLVDGGTSWVQAYQTMRKGNKKFAVFDLHVTLAWEGHWVDGDVKVWSSLRATPRMVPESCVLVVVC